MKAYNLDTAQRYPDEITELYLHHCGLTGIPEVVWACPNLRRLEITDNQLHTLPPSIGRLSQLEYISLAGNKIQKIPAEMAALSRLRQLDLSNNCLSCLPEAILALSQIRSLNLSGNQLTELPASISGWQKLEKLDLSGNQLRKLSVRLGHLRSLRDLRLNSNQMRSLPRTMNRLQRLERLEIEDNRLKKLPLDLFEQWLQLERLHLSGNRLSEIPDSIRQCSQLSHLLLKGNRLRQLSAGIGQLSWLRRLDISGNKLTSLPQSLGQCRFLQQIDASENQITTIPPNLSYCHRLELLNLRRNAIRQLPALPSAIRELDLSHNDLKSVPVSVLQLSRLRRLDLGYNKIEELPPAFRQLNQLRELRLKGNPIKEFPPVLLQLDELEQIIGVITGKARKQLLRLLKAFGQEQTPAQLRPVFHRAYTGEEKALATLSFEDLHWGLQFPLKKLRLMLRRHIIQERGRQQPLTAGSRMAIAGRIPVDEGRLEERLAGKGVILSAPDDEHLTHLLLGEEVPSQVSFTGSLTYIEMATLQQFLHQGEGEHSWAGSQPRQLERLRQLLLHPEPANVRLGLQLLRGGGVPKELLTDLFFVWKNTKDRRLKKDLRQLLELYFPETDRHLLSLRLSLSPSLSDQQLADNIRRFGQAQSLEIERLRALVYSRKGKSKE